MEKLTYAVRFTTPGFLGNARQSGQWRTPPLKALLRQWWRVVWAAKRRFPTDVRDMRRDEGLLFGDAGRDGAALRSSVRIRLSRWSNGKAKDWQGREGRKVFHPEVQRTDYRRTDYRVGPQSYLGYGPLDGRGGTKFGKHVSAAIDANEKAHLSIALPGEHRDDLLSTLSLISAYGAVGGRCRNGWGSISLNPPDDGSPALATDLAPWSRPWRQALKLDWPHAIGCDTQGALVWQTRQYSDWENLMRDLAIVKIGLRTMFAFRSTRHTKPTERHWLSYPVTRHRVDSWGNSRLPNSLRFKVRPDATAPSKLRGVIFHVPCRPPPPKFQPDISTIREVWRKSHRLLDELAGTGRTYAMITDRRRRTNLKQHLDKITLQRVPQ